MLHSLNEGTNLHIRFKYPCRMKYTCSKFYSVKSLNALIVDDDKINRESLKFLLENDCEGVTVIGMCASAKEAREFLANSLVKPAVVFLDIQMPDETGFDFLASIVERNFEVIFTTAHDNYFLQAIKVSAADYLIKPISIDDLQLAVEKVKKLKRQVQPEYPQQEIIENLLQNLNNTQQTKIALPHISGIKFVPLQDITHLEADSNYTIVHLQNLQKIVVSKSLKEFEEILPPQEFMRVHKSSIINFKYVKEYSGIHGGEIVLLDGNSVPISKKYYDQFIAAMKHVSLTFKRYG